MEWHIFKNLDGNSIDRLSELETCTMFTQPHFEEPFFPTKSHVTSRQARFNIPWCHFIVFFILLSPSVQTRLRP